MTNPTQPSQQFKSTRSNRFVVPGWTNMVPGKPDAVEIQIDLDQSDLSRTQASILIEYWATPEELTLQSVLPVRAFTAATTEGSGWCVFVPAQGRVLVRALDPQPDPPMLASHWINVDPATVPGTVVNVAINFPDQPTPAQNLLLGN
ncbi:uracil-DNA glycosylase [Deinococcus antarcticus]|uniref:Uracil-DNA glycosylase n=1 Tax=Deinococcus antarcticus TaxID=1298767 RepID=A0ABV8ABX7_9DEIO